MNKTEYEIQCSPILAMGPILGWRFYVEVPDSQGDLKRLACSYSPHSHGFKTIEEWEEYSIDLRRRIINFFDLDATQRGIDLSSICFVLDQEKIFRITEQWKPNDMSSNPIVILEG